MSDQDEVQVPAAALSALRRAGVAAQPRRVRDQGPAKPLATFRVDRYVIMVARTDQAQRMNLIEIEGRHWAAKHGIPGPTVVASGSDGSWLLAQWQEIMPPTGADYVRAAMDVADRICEQPVWRPSAASSTWQAPRTGRVGRLQRMVTSGVNLRRWAAARAAAAALPADTMAHGDFYFRNTLWTSQGRLVVVDWEFAGAAPRFADHLRLWSTLKDPDDRDLALELLHEGRSRAELDHIGVLGRWLTHRLFAENISVPRRLQNTADREHARMVQRLGDDLYARTRP